MKLRENLAAFCLWCRGYTPKYVANPIKKPVVNPARKNLGRPNRTGRAK